jgi:hypothetical protein
MIPWMLSPVVEIGIQGINEVLVASKEMHELGRADALSMRLRNAPPQPLCDNGLHATNR